MLINHRTQRAPRLARQEARVVRFQLLLTHAERKNITAKACALNISASDLLRLGVLGEIGLRKNPRLTEQIANLAPAFSALSRLASNLNQLTRYYHVAALSELSPPSKHRFSDLLAMHHDIMLAISDIQETLLGVSKH